MKTLFDEPTARASDPATSKAAAVSAAPHAESIRRAVQWALAGGDARTDESIIDSVRVLFPRATESGIRTRRSELVKAGLVVDSGERGQTKTGRESIKWRVKNV